MKNGLLDNIAKKNSGSKRAPVAANRTGKNNARRISKKRGTSGSNEARREKILIQKRVNLIKMFPKSRILIGFKGDQLFDYNPVYYENN